MSAHTYLDDPGTVEALVQRRRDEPRYAIDTEFHREKTFFPKLALVQLAWEDEVVVVDPLAVDPAVLRPLLGGPSRAVLHAGDQDLEVLQVACGARPARIWDTQVAAGFLGLSSPSLGAVHERFLGERLPKGDRLTDWLARPLSKRQLAYAASDVARLLEIEDRQRSALEERGRLEWLDAELDRILEVADRPRDPDDAWRRIKQAGKLRGESGAVVRAVARWRDERAAEQDLPARFILPDHAVIGIAQALPEDLDALGRVRGLDGRHLRDRKGRELLEVVAQARDRPLERPAREPELDRDLRPLATLVAAWVAQRARSLDLDPALLATRADIEALLRGEEDARLARGWRARIVGEAIARLGAGDAALAFDGAGGLVLEERSRRPLGAEADG